MVRPWARAGGRRACSGKDGEADRRHRRPTPKETLGGAADVEKREVWRGAGEMGSGPWCDACVRVAAREKNEQREMGRWGVARGREVDRWKGRRERRRWMGTRGS